MASISSLGVGSGLNAEALVTQLMSVEKQSLTSLQTKESSVKTKISAFGSISSSVDSLKNKLSAMKSVNTLAATKATSSSTETLSATTGSTAKAGTYDINVTQLAKAQKTQIQINDGNTTTSGSNEVVGGGKLKFSVEGSTSPVEIDLSGNSTASIGDWRDAINTAGAGITASIINTASGAALTITADSSGKVVTFDTSDSPALLTGLSDTANNMTTAQKAMYTIDNIAFATDSNTDSSAISGVTLNLAKTGITTLTVARDTSNIQTAVKEFVTAYNDLNTKVKSLTAYDAANKKSNTLTGDSTVRNLQNQITSALGAQYGSGTYDHMANLGISLQKDGSLALDTAKLDTAISKDMNSVTSVITSAATALYNKTYEATKTGGMLSSKTESLNSMVKELTKRQDTMELRLTAIEKRYRTMFSSLDTTISGLSGTSSYLTQMLAKLS